MLLTPTARCSRVARSSAAANARPNSPASTPPRPPPRRPARAGRRPGRRPASSPASAASSAGPVRPSGAKPVSTAKTSVPVAARNRRFTSAAPSSRRRRRYSDGGACGSRSSSGAQCRRTDSPTGVSKFVCPGAGPPSVSIASKRRRPDRRRARRGSGGRPAEAPLDVVPEARHASVHPAVGGGDRLRFQPAVRAASPRRTATTASWSTGPSASGAPRTPRTRRWPRRGTSAAGGPPDARARRRRTGRDRR